jgi:hypothetical protein
VIRPDATVARYIENQQEHHMKENFPDEYRRMLKSFEVDYDERYIFKDPFKVIHAVPQGPRAEQ